MSDDLPDRMRTVVLATSRWRLARSDPRWLGRYLTFLVIDVLIVVFVLIVGLTDLLPAPAVLSFFVLGPACALISTYLGLAPSYFVARKVVEAIEHSAPGVQAWSLSSLPLNVDTIRKWAQHPRPRATLIRPTFAIFGRDSMSVWVKEGLSVSEVLVFPRESISLVRVIQNGTRPVINLGSEVEQSNQMAVVATKGGFSVSPAYLAIGAEFIEAWVRRKSEGEARPNAGQ